nr:hypothetical protein BaRGS_029213 [Batillaria attramentaria]
MAIVCMTYKMPVNVTGQASEPVMTMTPDNVTDGRAANMSLNLKGEFGWSAWFEGQVLAAYYYGFLVAALIDPAIHGMLANWAPISERSQLSAFEYSGIGVAGILTFLLSGFLCEIPADNGWPFVFYFYGAATLAFVVVWLRFARDRPEQHPNITDKELQFILSGRPHVSRHKKV